MTYISTIQNSLIVYLICSCIQNTADETPSTDSTSSNAQTLVVDSADYLGDFRTQSNNLTDQDPGKPKIIFDDDTIFIEEEGKVFAEKVINDSIYLYKVFKSEKAETDVGETILKVLARPKELIWSLPIHYEMTLIDKNHLIVVDFNKQLITYYSIEGGERYKIINMPEEYSISDGNDFVATTEGLFIKIVDSIDYSFRDILFINKHDWSFNLQNLELTGYFDLKKGETDNAVLVKDDEIILSF